MSNTPFPQDPHLTAIAIAYKNPDKALIADSVATRSSVESTLVQYMDYGDIFQAYTPPETEVGPRGRTNRVEVTGTPQTTSTKDQAIEVPLSWYDTNATGKNVKARERATEVGAGIVQLRREKRVADLVFNAASYAAGMKETLSGVGQMNHVDYAANGDPLGVVEVGLSKPLLRPNVLIFGQAVWSVFRRLPKVVKAVHGNAGDSGLAARQAVAELLEVQEVLVGEGFLNTAKPGEPVNLQRVWGKHIAAIHRDRTASSVGGITFAITFEFGTRVSGSLPDANVGMRGGEVVRTGESVRELVLAPHAGYFWENAIA